MRYAGSSGQLLNPVDRHRQAKQMLRNHRQCGIVDASANRIDVSVQTGRIDIVGADLEAGFDDGRRHRVTGIAGYQYFIALAAMPFVQMLEQQVEQGFGAVGQYAMLRPGADADGRRQVAACGGAAQCRGKDIRQRQTRFGGWIPQQCVERRHVLCGAVTSKAVEYLAHNPICFRMRGPIKFATGTGSFFHQ